MSDKFDSELFSRNYANYKTAFQKYMQDCQEYGSLLKIDLRVFIVDSSGRSSIIKDFTFLLKLFDSLPLRENVCFKIKCSWVLLQYFK